MFRIIPDGKSFSEYALLRDGESVLLRVATPADVPAVEALMKGVSRESLQMRFMGAVAYVSQSAIEAIAEGRAPAGLAVRRLARNLPLAWVEQEAALDT